MQYIFRGFTVLKGSTQCFFPSLSFFSKSFETLRRTVEHLYSSRIYLWGHDSMWATRDYIKEGKGA